MDIGLIIVGFLGGFAAGCINTLAGNGSAITLTILTEFMGLTPNQANATNRIGVLANSVAAITQFSRKGRWDIKGTEIFILIGFLGGVLGVWLATIVSNEMFMDFFKFMMVFMLIVVLFKPDRWIRDIQIHRDLPKYLTWPVYFVIGVYGGFIQMGMGIFFLVVMILIARFPVIKSNLAKMLVTLSFTLFSIVLFSWNGMIIWEAGLAMAIGQAIGAWIIAGYASRSPNAGLLSYWMLLIGILLSLIKLFDIDDWVIRQF